MTKPGYKTTGRKLGSRWRHGDGLSGFHPSNPRVEAFLDAIVAVYRKHGMSLSHEDTHGAFKIERDSAENEEWLRGAGDYRGCEED